MKKFINKYIVFLLQFILNPNYDNLKIINNYNMKHLKFNEIKIYFNNIYILKYKIYGYQIINELYNNKHKKILSINEINLNDYNIEFYTGVYRNDEMIIKLKSNDIIQDLKTIIKPIIKQESNNKIILNEDEFNELNNLF